MARGTWSHYCKKPYFAFGKKVGQVWTCRCGQPWELTHRSVLDGHTWAVMERDV